MPTIDLGDFSKIGALPPEGYYRFEVTKRASVKPTKAKDSHNIIIDGMLIDSFDPDFENFTMKQWLSLKVAARWKLKEVLEALTQKPWDDESTQLEIDEDDEMIDPDLEGTTAMVLLIHGTDQNNREQAQIRSWFPDDGTIQPGPNEI